MQTKQAKIISIYAKPAGQLGFTLMRAFCTENSLKLICLQKREAAGVLLPRAWQKG